MELKVDRSVSRIKAGCRPGNGIEKVFFTFKSLLENWKAHLTRRNKLIDRIGAYFVENAFLV